MQEKFIIDRFETGFAVCETTDRRMLDIPLEDIPVDSVEGDILLFAGGRYVKDMQETSAVEKRMQEKMEKLVF
jgi:hypothetical protein